jgi:outer membrane protein insertion porin family
VTRARLLVPALALALIAATGSPAVPAAPAAIGSPAAPVAPAATAATAATAASPARVAAVRFSPVDGIGPYRFAQFVVVRPGGPFSPELVERSVRLLRQTGLFSEVSAAVAPADAGAEVQFTLRPYPLVQDVRIKGNFLVLERDLAPLVRLRAAEPFREETMRGDVARLLRHYADLGYEKTTVVEQVARRGDEVRVTYRIGEGRPQVLREIVLAGNRGVGNEDALREIGLVRYSFFRDADLQRGLDQLREYYQRRGWLDARVDAEVAVGEGSLELLAVLTNPIKGILTLGPGGYRVVTVRVAIVEGRRYEADFRGLAAFGEGDLRPLLTFSRSGFFDEEEIEAGRERILSFYQERGYYLAEVDVRVDYEAGRVVYTVREGRPVTVAKVRLRGVTHFGEGWVLDRLATGSGPGGEPRLLRARDLAADRRRLESWYLDAGFTRVEVPQPEVWPEAGPAGAEVTFTVREGPRTLVRSISFDGAVALPAAKLREAADISEGGPYRASRLQPAADRVRAAYDRAGFAHAEVTARPVYSEDRASVDLRFAVVEGRLRRLGEVAVTGNGRTARRVIVRELPLKPGDPLDPVALAEGKNGLYDLGLFREVRYLLPEPVAPEAPQDLVLAVRERPTGFYGFGFGYESEEKLRGFVEVGEQNLFGTGRGLRWKSKVSTIGYRHDLFYQEPWLLGHDLKGQADLYQERREETGYDLFRRGLSLGVNRELSRQILLNLRYRYEFVEYSDVVPDLVAEEGPLESINITSVGAIVDLDLRDNPIAPRRGSYHLASVEIARPLFGGDSTFTKYQFETSWYLPLTKSVEIAAGGRAGFTLSLLTASDLPLSERFFLGGDRTVRGFADKEIGPKDAAGTPLGGDAFVCGNLELRFGLYKKLRGVVFTDAGELWSEQSGLPPSGMRWSAGVGLRYETLVGPVRLDWGYKLDREPGESPSRWHLTIGYPF